jgi:hypothetical protein
MKNIFLIPTPNPSRLYEFGGHLSLTNVPTSAFRNLNIFITSDEEIKEGDYYIAECGSIDRPIHKHLGKEPKGDYKKIILTTDQDLIKNGVQSISDEFLEWFVKNPSCEDVEVEKEQYILQHLFKPQEYKFRFKIIIPKEKNCTQDVVDEAMRIVSKDVRQPKCVRDGLVKQETLEEAAENCRKIWIGTLGISINDIFSEGAKWQAERMYSEEEVIEIIDKWVRYQEEIGDSKSIPLPQFIEQFKKK